MLPTRLAASPWHSPIPRPAAPHPPPQLGLELTLVSRALTYDSFQDALDDLSSLYSGAASLATLPLKAADALQGRASGAGQQQQQQPAGKSEA